MSQVELTHQKGKGGQLIFDNGLLAAFCQFKPEENTRDKIRQIIKDVLKTDYIELSPKQVSAAEIFAEIPH